MNRPISSRPSIDAFLFLTSSHGSVVSLRQRTESAHRVSDQLSHRLARSRLICDRSLSIRPANEEALVGASCFSHLPYGRMELDRRVGPRAQKRWPRRRRVDETRVDEPPSRSTLRAIRGDVRSVLCSVQNKIYSNQMKCTLNN